MRFVPAPIQTRLNCSGGGHATMTTLMTITRVDAQVFRYCAHNRDLIYGGNTYRAALGYSLSDIASADALDVDNVNARGALTIDGINEDDLRRGLLDNAIWRLFMVDFENLADGEIKCAKGWVGETTRNLNQFEAELRRLMQAYTRILGRIFAAECDATLGDTRCGINLADSSTSGWMVTGTLEGVSADGITLLDSNRTEPGPSGGVSISGITQADPGVVTTSTAHGFIEGEAIVQSGIGGMTAANGARIVRNPTATTYEIENTTDYPAYTSGGTATPFADSGWFDFGVITITSGENAGRSMEVKSYVPGVIIVQLPFADPLNGDENYDMVVGCNKTFATCIAKFDNRRRFRGFPHLRGNDALVQTGRHN